MNRRAAQPRSITTAAAPRQFVITLRADASDAPAEVRLRRLLKVAKRSLAMTCVDVREVPGEAPTFGVRYLLNALEISNGTLNTYAGIAGASTPGPGQHSHRYSGAEVAAICDLIIRRCRSQRTADRAKALRNHIQITIGISDLPSLETSRMKDQAHENGAEL